MHYFDITARSIAMEKRRIERVAERGPVWDESMAERINHTSSNQSDNAGSSRQYSKNPQESSVSPTVQEK